MAFANDPLNLLATKASLNQQKRAGDAATWRPPNRAFRCAYVARQAAVKQRHGAWVTEAEQAAMLRVLADCPGEPLPPTDFARMNVERQCSTAGAVSCDVHTPVRQILPPS